LTHAGEKTDRELWSPADSKKKQANRDREQRPSKPRDPPNEPDAPEKQVELRFLGLLVKFVS